MSNKKKLTEHQSGNEKLHSGETLNVIMTQTGHLSRWMLTLAVFLDLTNAFDSIGHDSFLQAFLQNLKALGVFKNNNNNNNNNNKENNE